MNNKKLKSLTASTARHWLHCPGFLDFTTSPDPLNSTNSKERQKGVDFHKEVEHVVAALNAGRRYTARPASDAPETAKWLHSIENRLRIDLQEYGGTFLSEQEFSITLVSTRKGYESLKLVARPDVILDAGPVMIIYDIKTGMFPIPAENDEELFIGVHMFLDSLSREVREMVETVRGVILQPSIGSTDSAEIKIVPEFLVYIASHVFPTSPRKLITGQHCLYCPMADICPEFSRKLKAWLSPSYRDQTIDRVDKWAEILEVAKPIRKAIESIESTAQQAVQAGVNIPGWSLDYRNAQRSWNHAMPPASLAKYLGLRRTDVVTEKLLSPAKVEAVLTTEKAKERFSEIITQGSYPVLTRTNKGELLPRASKGSKPKSKSKRIKK